MSFFNYKKGSKKGYMEREGFFYYEIHMKCAKFIHFTLLLEANSKKFFTNQNSRFYESQMNCMTAFKNY